MKIAIFTKNKIISYAFKFSSNEKHSEKLYAPNFVIKIPKLISFINKNKKRYIQ